MLPAIEAVGSGVCVCELPSLLAAAAPSPSEVTCLASVSVGSVCSSCWKSAATTGALLESAAALWLSDVWRSGVFV